LGGAGGSTRPNIKVGTRWHYLVRASDEHGQLIDGYLSDRRNAAAAESFFEAASDARTVTPTRVTTDTATCSPPALRAVLPHAEHRSSKYLNNGLERDHHQLNGRRRSMRSCKTFGGARTFRRGHTLIRTLGCSCSALAGSAPARLRLAAAWTALAAII
jgi:putative transposase